MPLALDPDKGAQDERAHNGNDQVFIHQQRPFLSSEQVILSNSMAALILS
jgi:hypothetical protein